MTAWHEIVSVEGSPDTQDIGFNLIVTVPEISCGFPATERQKESVTNFYHREFDDLCECRAHAMLSCREYARLCSEALFKDYPDHVQRLLSRCLAVFVLADPEMVKFITKWSDRNFERGTGSPRVRGTPFFADVEQFASYLEGSLAMNGWTREEIKANFKASSSYS